MIEGIGKILNGVLIFLIATAASLAIANPEKIGIREEPLRDLPAAAAATSNQLRCGDLFRSWQYFNACAPPAWDDLSPQLNCPFDRPSNVSAEPTSYALARAMRDRYREQLIVRECMEAEPGEKVDADAVEDRPELSAEDRQSRLQGLMQRTQGDDE